MNLSADGRHRHVNSSRSKLLWAAYASFLLCWSLNSYILLINWWQEGNLLTRKINGRPYIADFVDYYAAGQFGLSAKQTGINIYDPKVQAAAVARLTAPVVAEIPFYLQYPPLFFVLCTPLTFLPLKWSWIFWNLSGVICLLAVVLGTTGRHLSSRLSRALTVAAVACSYPVWLTFELGQTSLFFLAGMALFWWLLGQRRYWTAGLATFLLMIKIQYLPFAIICGVVLGRFRYTCGCLIAACVAVLISILFLGWDNCLEWTRIISHAETTAQYSGVAAQHQQNLRGILCLLLGGDTRLTQIIAAAGCLFSAAAVGFFWTKPFAHLSKRTSWSFAICATLSTIIMLLFSVHTHTQDYCLLVLPGLWLYLAAAEQDATQDKKHQILRTLILAFPPASWLLFLLGTLPAFPTQPFAIYALCLAASTWWIWLSPTAASPHNEKD